MVFSTVKLFLEYPRLYLVFVLYPKKWAAVGRQCSHLKEHDIMLNAPNCGAGCRALREQVLAQATADAEAGVLPNGDYKGLNNYTDYKKV